MAATSVTKTDLYEFMDRQKLGVLGTISPEGVPQSSLVGIAVTPALEIIFDTVKSSRKYGNLIANPLCSFAMGWSGETTVQYQGDAREPSGAELARGASNLDPLQRFRSESAADPGVQFLSRHRRSRVGVDCT